MQSWETLQIPKRRRTKQLPRGPKLQALGPPASLRSLFAFIYIVLPPPLSLQALPCGGSPCGLPGARARVVEETPVALPILGWRPRGLGEPLGIPIAPPITSPTPSKSPRADLPALVMIISVPASWNFFQSSFSCRPTLTFSTVWGREGGELVSAWPTAPAEPSGPRNYAETLPVPGARATRFRFTKLFHTIDDFFKKRNQWLNPLFRSCTCR